MISSIGLLATAGGAYAGYRLLATNPVMGVAVGALVGFAVSKALQAPLLAASPAPRGFARVQSRYGVDVGNRMEISV